MKKRTLKKIVPFGILFFGISLLLWNCEKEEFRGHIVLDETASNYHSRIIALDDIYDVKKYLDNLLPQNSSNKSSEIEGAIFDQDMYWKSLILYKTRTTLYDSLIPTHLQESFTT